MEVKTIITVALVVFIIAGLAFLYIRNRKKRK
jgi:LPXTG-motif cell wall-anchored protein